MTEMRDREAFIEQKKKSRKDRQKEEQAEVRPTLPPVIAPDLSNDELEELHDHDPSDIPEYEIWDFDDDDF